MQTSAVIFNTKPLLLGPPAQLKPISSTDSSSPLFSGHNHNWIHRTKAISIRTRRYPRSRAYLTISKVIASCIVLVFLFLLFFLKNNFILVCPVLRIEWNYDLGINLNSVEVIY